MHTLDGMLAKSSWAQALQSEALQRARAAIVVRELAPVGYIFHKGDDASLWIGVIDGLVTSAVLTMSAR